MKSLGMTTKVVVGIGIVIAIAVLVGSLAIRTTFEEEYEKFRAVKPGMTEEEVVQLLGKPFKVYEKETAPKNYYIEGYAFKERPITSKVYIYVASEPILYVYIDKNKKVEDMFLGGS